MSKRFRRVVLALFLFVGLFAHAVMALAENETLRLVHDGKPASKIVILSDNPADDGLLDKAAGLLVETTHRWSDVKLPIAKLKEAKGLPTDEVIVLATFDSLKKLAPDVVAAHKELASKPDLDKQGFVLVPLKNKDAKQLFVVSPTARGVFNAAVYMRDFCIDGDKRNLSAEFLPVVRSPRLGGRSAYTLTIWGNEAQYTPRDWATIFDRFARDGVDTIYFWTSGHFPSKKFPQTYKCVNRFEDRVYDTTAETRIGTVEDLNAIVASAHGLGMKIYLGGGLGAWCGTQFLTNLDPETLKPNLKEPWLCPSNAKSRAALVDYYQEMFAAIPEADGLFIESADELGPCNCPLCSKELDDHGSKQFGQAQLTLCQEIMGSVWRDHPQAHLAYTIGYKEHAKDVAYYHEIQRLSGDPRFEWVEARGSWTFPGPSGEAKDAAYFSNKVMRWEQYYLKPLEISIADANRIGRDKMFGMSMSFSPGFASGSFYKEIPYPTEILPYALNGFVYREATWNPELSADEMRERIQKCFFGKEAPKHLTADLWKLREMIRTRIDRQELDAIALHIQEASAGASPKTAQGLAMMTRAVTDIRQHATKKAKKE